MKTLLCTVGLPKSGKSTWAKKFSHDHNVPIVNPDSVRLAIHGQRFCPAAEKFVWATTQVMVKALFLAGHECVILDATNTTAKRREEWKCPDWNTLFVLFDELKEECLRRADAAQDTEIVPIIERMAAQWELPDPRITVTPLGATGMFPEGSIDQTDEGEIRLAIAADQENGVVRIEFGKPVAWLGFPREQALALAGSIQTKAMLLRS